jgi:SAM-dependent methyltransferase
MLSAHEAYSLWASDYDAALNPLLSLEQRAISPLRRSAVGCDVVDLGCGTGRWLVQLEQIGPRSLTGIDFSAEMLGQAMRKIAPTTRVLESDCLRTTLASNSADWIIASFLLSYIENIYDFAREAARIARPGALVLVSDVHPAAAGYGWRRTFRRDRRTIEIVTYPYDAGDLNAAMDHAGFQSTFFQGLSFGEEEEAIFIDACRPDLYTTVEGLPVLLIAGYRRKTA